MIPVEFLWLTLFLLTAVVGAMRGLSKELGTSAILLLCLFGLRFSWTAFVEGVVTNLSGSTMSADEMEAIYYIVVIAFVAFISYEGVVLQFPVSVKGGIVKTVLGFLGGLLNGYLLVGTNWGAANLARYFGIEVSLGSTGQTAQIANTLTPLHNAVVQYLPLTFVPDYVLLALGIILLLAIVFK